MSDRITDLALGPGYRTQARSGAPVLLCIGVIAAGVCIGTFLGVLGFSEYSRWQYPHEYMPAPDADYAE